MKSLTRALTLGIAFVTLYSCSSNSGSNKKDDILAGQLPVIIDESVLPIILEQKDVFESSYTNATILPLPKPEVSAINALIGGEAATAVLTRELNETEKRTFEQRSIKPKIYKIAYDGIVLVGNRESRDTSFVINDVISILDGKNVRNTKLVFENLNSSVFRYFKDLGKLDKVANTYVEAKKTSEEVLEEISSNKDKVGLISYNQYLSLESSFTKKDKIRILSVLNDSLPEGKFIKPSQASLSTGEYPLKREILVLNYQANHGLGIGFSAFMTGDRGQRIVLKSGLLPATMPGREIIIRDRIN